MTDRLLGSGCSCCPAERTMLRTDDVVKTEQSRGEGTEKCGLVASGVYPPITQVSEFNRKDEVSLYFSELNTHETQANLGTHRTQ